MDAESTAIEDASPASTPSVSAIAARLDGSSTSAPASVDAGSGSTGEPCAWGTLEQVIACRREGCSQRVHDATGPALAGLGWRLVTCDQEPRPFGDFSGAEGHVWLYRVDRPDGSLRFAHGLTSLGATSKYQHDARFEIVKATERVIGGRPALWLEWRLRETAHLYNVEENAAWDRTHVTACASAECCLTLTKRVHERHWPSSPRGPEPWAASAELDVRAASDADDTKTFAVDVTLTRLETAIDSVESFAGFVAGHDLKLGRNRCRPAK